ncbi:MAG: A/G-specific adenine glycosylase [Xanthobacteraceae bacterium]|nr:MAG: A/G-specific adenine glycosylase [Xanthobacteraceae bacterium]
MSLTGVTARRKDTQPTAEADRPARLLAWYDRHRRHLPWRAAPGAPRDAYRVWLSEIMLQQTTVRAVAPYFSTFVARWPDVGALAAASLDDVLKAWAGLGYYSRARNLHACAGTVMREHGGTFPADVAALRRLPGVGPYTAAAIAAIAFDRAVMPVDGNIERVVARLFAVEDMLPQAKSRIHELAESLVPQTRAGDMAQALMDLGAMLCTPRNPSCAMCPFNDGCAAYLRGDAATFPRKAPKKSGAPRFGAAFVVRRADGKVLVRTRPAKGLLGGMTEVPTTAWSAGFDLARAKDEAPRLAGAALRWRCLAGTVDHVFTHFPLALTVYVATAPRGTRAPRGMRWVAADAVHGEALPTLMRKVLAHAGIGPAP